ncbi:MAG: MmcQ/YjbR family DNA-binding protein [Flavobacteriales bacterium]
MNIEEFRDYCLNKFDVSEEFPFGPDVLVFKVAGKMFALTNVDSYVSVNLKCKPEWAIELREEYMSIAPGYHMNKKHWNTIEVHGDVGTPLLHKLIDHSYELVVKGLPKTKREAIIAANSADN